MADNSLAIEIYKNLRKFNDLNLLLKNKFKAELNKIDFEDAIKIFNELSSIKIKGHDYTKDPAKSEFRCSGLVSECSRIIVLANYLNWDSEYYIQKSQEGGNLIHAVVQHILEKVNTQFNSETIEPEANFEMLGIKITGHIDILIVNFEEKIFIIDIKTNKDMSYKNTHPYWIIKNSHINQVILYVAYYLILNKHVKKENVYGVLWYIERTKNQPDIEKMYDDNKWLFYTFKYDQMRFINLLHKAKKIVALLNQNLIPEPMDKDFWLCENVLSKCQYYDYCHTDKKLITLQEVKLLNKNK